MHLSRSGTHTKGPRGVRLRIPHLYTLFLSTSFVILSMIYLNASNMSTDWINTKERNFNTKPIASFFPLSSGIKMYRFSRPNMMYPMMHSGMGMAPFFKVKPASKLNMIMHKIHTHTFTHLIFMAHGPAGDGVRAGALPGQVSGVHFRVLQHPAVRLRQHPLHPRGEWRVSVCCCVEI